MNKKLLSLGICALTLASTSADAFYLGAGTGNSKIKAGGFSMPKDSAYTLSTGFSIPLPLIPIRAELEMSQMKSGNNIADGKLYGASANAYVGLPLLPIIKPYAGMGLGYMQEKITGLGKSDWKVVPQYMLGLDLDLPLIPVAGGIEYRYIDTTFDHGATEVDSKIHTVLVKGRIKL